MKNIIFPTLCAVIVMSACTFFLLRQNSYQPALNAIVGENAQDPLLVPSPTGPWPKLTVDQDIYNFGTMEINTKTEHTFVIKNEGDAPLNFKNGGSTCQCTISDLPKDEIGILNPGETKEVTLTISPEVATDEFDKHAVIVSNDPNNPEQRLVVQGRIVEKYKIFPRDQWVVGTVTENDSKKFSGAIASEVLDSFEIINLKSSDDKLTVSTAPMSESELAEVNCKSGHLINCEISPEITIGEYNANLTLEFSFAPGEVKTIPVTAYRAGQLKVMGAGWFAQEKLVNFGTFKAAEGREQKLMMFIDKNDAFQGPFEMTKESSDPPFLDIKMEPFEASTNETRLAYYVYFILPANMSPDVRAESNAGYLKVKTNHPEMNEIRFKIRYSAQ